uniref:HDC01182 n=1 Tax=Drosophila melanogaster TaxID=7227 RepID=Q6IHS9_DROME|nr:TPA_inf: HDC01182 [Drosophila melanogaster]
MLQWFGWSGEAIKPEFYFNLPPPASVVEYCHHTEVIDGWIAWRYGIGLSPARRGIRSLYGCTKWTKVEEVRL